LPVGHQVSPSSAPAGRRRPSLATNLSRLPALVHTCYRVLDLERSIEFYESLGMEELRRVPIRDEATNVFMGLPGDGARLELTHNHDRTEPYEIGTGYGHIAIAVEDLDGALERLAEVGIEPEKPPYSVREGGSRLCFVRDPDGYRIEIIEPRATAQRE
jgi:lactoylglutathione lyase